MSYANTKAQLVTALQSVSWTIPASAAAITAPVLNTSFGTIGVQQFAGAEAAISTDKLPYVRISVPDLDEARKTSGGDFGSYKTQTIPAHLFLYQVGYTKDWQGLADYFDAVVDATIAYFRHHSSPQGDGGVAGDVIRGWGLHITSRMELPDQFGALLVFRATVAVDVIGVAV